MKLIRAVALIVSGFAMPLMSEGQVPKAPGRWTQPTAELAGEIADILGPGQAILTIRNLSTIQASDVPEIRKLIEQDLKTRGVMSGSADSANAIRITLSENTRERLWVAEIVEGNETRVAMVHVDAAPSVPAATPERMILRRERIELVSRSGGNGQDNPVVAAAEINGQFIVMYPDRISIFAKGPQGWTEVNTFAIEKKLSRDPRGVLTADAGGSGFKAWVPGAECTGSFTAPVVGANSDNGWTVHCRTSDDPWPVYQTSDAIAGPVPKSFYNSARNFFTGVVTPSVGLDLPAFYAAGMVPRAAGGVALLITGVDGKVGMVENGALHPIAGTRDWGSDFAVVHSGCGGGTQVITSSSGQAATDSLRAFEIPALEAVPASSPLAIDGTVTTLWSASDGKSAFAVVRNTSNQYEVDRVTALCN